MLRKIAFALRRSPDFSRAIVVCLLMIGALTLWAGVSHAAPASCSVANGVGVIVNGQCTIKTCNAGFLDCDRDPRSGCEVKSSTDPQHCGSCGNVCKNRQHCTAGKCA